MKKINILVILGFFCIAGTVQSQVLDKTVATVSLYKTEKITKNELDTKLKLWASQTKQQITDDVKETVLTATINDILISQAAAKAGVVATNQQVNEVINRQKEVLGAPISDADLKNFIEAQSGLSWESYKEQVRTRIVQEQYIYKKYVDQIQEVGEPSSSDISETYDLYATQFTNPAMVRVEHLFWDTRDNSKSSANQKRAAETVAKEIKKSPQKFDGKLENSLDDSSYEGGDLGFIIRDDSTLRILGAKFLEEVFSLQKGNVSDVIETTLGYHIVMVTDKRKAKLLSLEDPVFPGENSTVKDRIVSLLKNQKQQENFLGLVQDEVDALREDAKIRILTRNY